MPGERRSASCQMGSYAHEAVVTDPTASCTNIGSSRVADAKKACTHSHTLHTRALSDARRADAQEVYTAATIETGRAPELSAEVHVCRGVPSTQAKSRSEGKGEQAGKVYVDNARA